MNRRAKSVILIAVCVALVALVFWQRTQIIKLNQHDAELRAQVADVRRQPAAEPAKPTSPPVPDPELLRLRAEVAELRRQKTDLTRTAAASRVQQTTTAADSAELPLDLWRRNNAQVLKSLVLALHFAIADREQGKPPEKLQIANTNGELAPELRREIEKLLKRESSDVNIDAAWRDIELLITDAADLDKLDPVTIIARTVPRKTPDGKWMRVYAIADGSAHVRVHNTPDEVWQAPAP